MALGLCIQFIDLSTRRSIEQTPWTQLIKSSNELFWPNHLKQKNSCKYTFKYPKSPNFDHIFWICISFTKKIWGINTFLMFPKHGRTSIFPIYILKNGGT